MGDAYYDLRRKLESGAPLSPQDVRDCVRVIDEIRGDDESAHSLEDALHQAVLENIARYQPENAAELALEALKTNEIAFARWCA